MATNFLSRILRRLFDESDTAHQTHPSDSTGQLSRRLSVENMDFEALNSSLLQVIDPDEHPKEINDSPSSKISMKRRVSVGNMDFKSLNSSLAQVANGDIPGSNMFKPIESSKINLKRRLSVEGMDFQKLSTSLSKAADESNTSKATGSDAIVAKRRLSVEGMDFRKLNTSFSHVVDTSDIKLPGSDQVPPAYNEKSVTEEFIVPSSNKDRNIQALTADIIDRSKSYKNMDFKGLQASLSRANYALSDVMMDRILLIHVQEINSLGKISEKGFVTRELYNYIVDLVSANNSVSDLQKAADNDSDAQISGTFKPATANNGATTTTRRASESNKNRSKSSSNLQSMVVNREQNWSALRPQPQQSTQSNEKSKKQQHAGAGLAAASHPGRHAQLPLRLRDLHRLDPYLMVQVDGEDGWDCSEDDVQFILVRRGCILFAYGKVRAVILPNMLLLLHRYDKHLVANYKYGNLLQQTMDDTVGLAPFEVRALEALLKELQTGLRVIVQKTNSELQELLLLLRFRPEWGCGWSLPPLPHMARMKNHLSKLLTRVHRFKELLAGPLEDDELMAQMNLTYLVQQTSPRANWSSLANTVHCRHDMVEELLESCFIEFNSIEITATQMHSQLGNAEALVKLRLSTSENELLMLHSKVFVFTCCVSFGVYATGLNAMNFTDLVDIPADPSIANSTVTVTAVPIEWYAYHNNLSIVVSCATVVIFVGFFLLVKYFENSGVYPKKVLIKS